MVTQEHELHKAVVDDVTLSLEELAQEDSPWRRRSFVRAAFASIEALTFILKQDALRLADAQPSQYTVGQLALLREEGFSLNSKGEVHSSPRFIPSTENFRFAVDMVMQGLFPGFRLSVDVPEWTAFKRAVKVRNRIVHPKGVSDLTVSDEDKADVLTAFQWVNASTIRSLFNAYSARSKVQGSPLPPEVAEIGDRWKLMSQ